MIYLLEDDDSIRDFVIYTLNSQGMEARGFGLPSEFWNAMADQVPSLVLLDVMLPEEDGLSVLKKLRSAVRTAKLPIIMLTAKGTEYDKVLGLDGGADDYVTKPFGMMELLSREQLIENVWGYAFTGESRTVDVHVRTLRQKLGEAGAYVETVRGYGYKISQEG